MKNYNVPLMFPITHAVTLSRLAVNFTDLGNIV